MSVIIEVCGRQIFDSRGYPAVEVDVTLDNGIKGRASVPSGASTGLYEAVELRDNDEKKFNGKGVLTACKNINNEISDMLVGLEVNNQNHIDTLLIDLDGTPNKRRLGANATLGVSLAIARAAAVNSGKPLYACLGGDKAKTLPVPMMNIINGGAHADNKLDFQEFMIMPIGADTFSKAMQIGAEIFQTLKSILQSKGLSTNVGDEGGFAPALSNAEDAIEVILKAIQHAGYEPYKDVVIALDCAASEYYSDGMYKLSTENKLLSSKQKVEFLSKLTKSYPIYSIEDGLDQNDWFGWLKLTQLIGQTCQLVGDDLFATNPDRLQKGINEGVANSILIKPNQIGTLSETLNTIRIAEKANYKTIISHRSGETEDSIIADIAVATSSSQIKAGAISRSDRLAKYNQLLRIEEMLSENARFAGADLFLKQS